MNTTDEKLKLKQSKKTFNSMKRLHPTLHANLRDAMIKDIVAHKLPDWGGIQFTVTKKGI